MIQEPADLGPGREDSGFGASRPLSMARSTWATHWDVIVPVIVAAALRVVWVAVVRPVPVTDFAVYFKMASGIAAGHGYQYLGHPSAYWPVGYPAALAGLFAFLGPSVWVAQALNIALWCTTAGLASVLGTRLGNRWAGLSAGLLVAMYPDFVFVAGILATENLAVPLLLGVFLCLVPRARSATPSLSAYGVAGVLLGGSALVRSSAQWVPLLFAGWLIVAGRSRRSAEAAAVLVLAFGLTVSPWVLRNAVVIGTPQLSTNGGDAIWRGNNPLATGGPSLQGGRSLPPQLPPYQGPGTETPQHLEARSDAYLYRQGISYVLRHPGATARLIPAKARLLFGAPATIRWSTLADDEGDLRATSGLESLFVELASKMERACQYLQVLVWLLGLYGIALAARERRQVAAFAALLLLYFLGVHLVLAHAQPRYLLPLTVLLVPFAALGAVEIFSATLRKASSGGRA